VVAYLTRQRVEALALSVVFFGGLGLLSLGAGMVYRPAGFIVAGVLLAVCAVLYLRGSPRTPVERQR
jgi:hypothetical protein